MVFDSTGYRLLIFGGRDGSGNNLNDLWSMSTLIPEWSMLSPAGGPPAARERHTAVMDSAHQRMTVFGGSNASGVLNDSWVLNAPYTPPLGCFYAGMGPNYLRAQGISEQVGDIVLYCEGGGAPTPQGKPIPEYTVAVTLNTNVTSRFMPQATSLSEALLIVDEAFPAAPIPSYAMSGVMNPPPQILCMPLGSECAETGTGGTPSPYQTQPNVFVGKQSGTSTLYWKVPIDPPTEAQGMRRIRLTNLLANASQLGMPSGANSIPIQASVSIKGAEPGPMPPGPLLVGSSLQGMTADVPSPGSVPQCETHNAVLLGGSGTAAFDFSVQAMEGFPYAFEIRNYGTYLSGLEYPPALDAQNVLDYPYYTETGFYYPGLFTSAPTLGLADFGTRILVSFGSVSAGTKLFVPTAITMTGEYGSGNPGGQLQLVQAGPNGNSAPGYEPVASTAMIGTTPVAEAYSSGTTAYAVYEVIYSLPSVVETATIPVAVAFTNVPAAGTVNATTSLAPLSTVGTANEASSIPRFANFSTAEPAYSITSCAAVKQ
jgi:hypothetical protein